MKPCPIKTNQNYHHHPKKLSVSKSSSAYAFNCNWRLSSEIPQSRHRASKLKWIFFFLSKLGHFWSTGTTSLPAGIQKHVFSSDNSFNQMCLLCEWEEGRRCFPYLNSSLVLGTSRGPRELIKYLPSLKCRAQKTRVTKDVSRPCIRWFKCWST